MLLNRIIAHKRQELRQKRELYPVKLLERSVYFETRPLSLVHYLKRSGSSGIIAEIKRTSPAVGELKHRVDVDLLSVGYMQSGAAALSIVTDYEFFKGTGDDLTIARRNNLCPILRKDFIFDEYQVVEAKSLGADAILLIAAVLSRKEQNRLARTAQSLGLEVLLEVHNQEEIRDASYDAVSLVGVNNRNLQDLSVDVHRSFSLLPLLPRELPAISESGISAARTVSDLYTAGYAGVLIGEAFMRESSPAQACYRLIADLRQERGKLQEAA